MSKKDFSLIVSIPGEDPARHDLSGDSITVGRGPDNGIQVLVSEVSVQHGALNATEESYRIVDNGSTNGTKVNGTPVGDGVELSPMDRILLGDTVPAYFVPSAILEATPVAEVVASIEERAKESPAPVATQPAAPAAPVV
jgi:pSer/pThr/pTyr-binding forkhead associated (FHA) protein